MDEEISSLLKCKVEPRGWGGYLVDIITMGGYTTYRVFEYTKCIQKDHREQLEKLSPPVSNNSKGVI